VTNARARSRYAFLAARFESWLLRTHRKESNKSDIRKDICSIYTHTHTRTRIYIYILIIVDLLCEFIMSMI